MLRKQKQSKKMNLVKEHQLKSKYKKETTMKLNLSLINSKILLITGITIVLGCSTNNVTLNKGIRDSTENVQKCELSSLIYRSSFQYIYSDLFKTGKIKH